MFYFLNVFIPLLIGSCVYVLFRPDTYIARCIYGLFPITLLQYTQFGAEQVFIRNFLCDMLWAYALYVAIVVFVEDKKIFWAGGFSWGLCVLVEVFQKTGLLNGTGDLWDVFFEGIAIMTAMLVTIIYERKKDRYEKENN